MKRFIISLLFCLALLATENHILLAKYDKESVQIDKNFGIGLSVNPIVLLNPDTEGIDMPAALINFHLPIHINKTFRIEPEFGFYSGTNDFTELRGYKYVNSLSYYRVGIGGFYTLNTYPKTSMYIGPRICILFSNFERKRALPGMMTHSENILEKAVMFGASFGGEYVLTNYLSLGMELQLNYYNYYEQGEFKFDSFDKIVSKTNGLIFLRIYLF